MTSAEAFFDLARLEESVRRGMRTAAFPRRRRASTRSIPRSTDCGGSSASNLRRWGGARFAVALSHDVDIPWRWTRQGIRGGARQLKDAILERNGHDALVQARGLAGVPLHKLRGTDPNFSFERIVALERARGAESVFFVLAGFKVAQDGPAPDDVRPALATRGRDAARPRRGGRPSCELLGCVRRERSGGGEGRARAARRDASRSALPLPPGRSSREPRLARASRHRLRLEPRLLRDASVSAPASRTLSAPGASSSTVRSTSWRSRSPRWT